VQQEINQQYLVRKIRDRYKPLFCDQNFYETNQKNFALLATKISLEKILMPCPFEKFILCTLFLSLLRRPQDWFGGLRKDKFVLHNSPSIDIIDSNKPFNSDFLSSRPIKPMAVALGIKWPQVLSDEISFYEFIQLVKIKSVPDSVFWSLNFIINNKQLFIITQQIPTPYELLSIQARGQRVLTFDDNFQIWPELNYGHRDVLSFWLHDLIHAAEFFQDRNKMRQQIFIYRWIELLMNLNVFSEFLLHCKNRIRFEYLISDMNSHPLHLLKTLRAILDEASPGLWSEVLTKTENILGCSNSVDDLQMVNSEQFTPAHYDAMLQILSCINEKWVLSNKLIATTD
jgi:hypothetical protein